MYFGFLLGILRILCGYFAHQRRQIFEGCVADPLQTIQVVLIGSMWIFRLEISGKRVEVKVKEMAKNVLSKLKDQVMRVHLERVAENAREGRMEQI